MKLPIKARVFPLLGGGWVVRGDNGREYGEYKFREAAESRARHVANSSNPRRERGKAKAAPQYDAW